MNMNRSAAPTLSEREVAGLRQNVSMLRSQLSSGRIDPEFFNRQLEKFDELLTKAPAKRKPRKATKPSKSAKQERIKKKKAVSEKKKWRRKPEA